ncbi:uroporphyrinogen-III synthase [Achromobacter sp. F4_2707]|uniref:uroporphyrinogen-III synthase n=1 Tax=Achromobacter sp. F4_2707 TaxID=3114286 RepID=UPI0039C63545
MIATQVFLTRPEGRNGSVPQRLRESGMAVAELPALAIQPLPLSRVPAPENYDVIVFVSRYAAQRYLDIWAANGGLAQRWPQATVAATVGASSAQALLRGGLPAHAIVHPPADAVDQDSEALLALLQQRGTTMRRVLIVRGTQGRGWLAQTLTASGAQVEFLPVYERVAAPWPETATNNLSRALQRPQHCVFLLTSSEGVQAMAKRLEAKCLLAAWSMSTFIVIHERIGATLQSVFEARRIHDAVRIALCTPDDDSIVQAIHAVAGPTAEP